MRVYGARERSPVGRRAAARPSGRLDLQRGVLDRESSCSACPGGGQHRAELRAPAPGAGAPTPPPCPRSASTRAGRGRRGRRARPPAGPAPVHVRCSPAPPARRTRSAARPRRSVRGRMNRPTPTATKGSAYRQPVTAMITAATITPTEPSRSPITSRYAPRTLMLSRAPERNSANATRLTHQAAGRHDQHRPGRHLRRVGEPADRLHHHEARDAGQQDRVGQGGEHLQPVQPERALASRCPARPAAVIGGQRHGDAEHVGEHVAGVGEQRQRAGDQAATASTTMNAASSDERAQSRPRCRAPACSAAPPWSCRAPC